MVAGPHPASAAADERGQLILIGAIAMALIVIGLVLVVNTALFTQVVGTEGTVETTKDAGVAGEELEDSVSAVAHHQNVAPGDADDTDMVATVNTDDEFREMLLNASLDGDGALVDVAYRGEVESGRHIYNGSGAGFEIDGDPDPTLVSSGDVGYYHLVIDVPDSNGITASTTVEVTDNNDTTESLVINSDGSDHVYFTPSTGSGCTANASQDTVRADVYGGVVYEESGRDCNYDLFSGRPGPYNVTVTGADNLAGSYSLVTNESSGPSWSCPTSSNVNCDPAIWSYELEYEYETVEVSADTPTTREVDVYE